MTDTAQTFAGVSDEWDVDAVREIMSGSGPLDWPTSEKIINRLLAIIDRDRLRITAFRIPPHA